MADMDNGIVQSQDTIAPVSSSQTAPVHEAPKQMQDERVFKQSEVNDIVKKAKYGAVEDYKRISSEQPQYIEQKYGQPQQPTSQYMPENDIRRMAAEEAKKHFEAVKQEAYQKSQDENAQRTVNNFYSKIAPGREKYQDFDAVTGDIEFGRFPNVVQLLAEHLDNSGDVLYELGKDRIKMANLESLAERSPRDAIVQAHRLAKSITDNAEAQNVRIPNKPLSQMRPSNIGTDTGAMSVSDYRKKYRV